PEENEWLQWVHILLLLFTMLLAMAWSARRASELRPGRWPPFLRFLLLSAFTYGGVAVYDSLLRRWHPNSDYSVSPGMAVCALLITLSLLGSWVSQLRPVRDRHTKWLAELDRLKDEARARDDHAEVDRIAKLIDL